uniref:proline-rich protein 36-like n=1 Tax=Ictidomys tridecemlineatus TaxID=43179 RepID=UPI001A9E142F|nr:proline-rich protein 36-like [Ictidomys tridecemlineatus]
MGPLLREPGTWRGLEGTGGDLVGTWRGPGGDWRGLEGTWRGPAPTEPHRGRTLRSHRRWLWTARTHSGGTLRIQLHSGRIWPSATCPHGVPARRCPGPQGHGLRDPARQAQESSRSVYLRASSTFNGASVKPSHRPREVEPLPEDTQRLSRCAGYIKRSVWTLGAYAQLRPRAQGNPRLQLTAERDLCPLILISRRLCAQRCRSVWEGGASSCFSSGRRGPGSPLTARPPRPGDWLPGRGVVGPCVPAQGPRPAGAPPRVGWGPWGTGLWGFSRLTGVWLGTSVHPAPARATEPERAASASPRGLFEGPNYPSSGPGGTLAAEAQGLLKASDSICHPSCESEQESQRPFPTPIRRLSAASARPASSFRSPLGQTGGEHRGGSEGLQTPASPEAGRALLDLGDRGLGGSGASNAAHLSAEEGPGLGHQAQGQPEPQVRSPCPTAFASVPVVQSLGHPPSHPPSPRAQPTPAVPWRACGSSGAGPPATHQRGHPESCVPSTGSVSAQVLGTSSLATQLRQDRPRQNNGSCDSS